MAADIQTLEAINASPGLKELDPSGTYRDDERVLTAATNATRAILVRDLLTPEDSAALRYPFDMVLDSKLRALSRQAASGRTGCLGAAVVAAVTGVLIWLR